MEIYLWTEDSKSGFDFWKLISDTLYAGKIHVESKKSNSKLVKNVEKLKDTKNMYLIAFDHVFDNSKIDDGSGTNTSMYGRLVDAVESKANVCLLDMYSFEYILLSFSELCNWVAQDRNSLIHPNGYSYIDVQKKLTSMLSGENASKNQSIYKNDKVIAAYCNDTITQKPSRRCSNIEQIAASLLKDITAGTGFCVEKSSIGDCWKADCCSLNAKNCGLANNEYTTFRKILELYEKSDLKDILIFLSGLIYRNEEEKEAYKVRQLINS